MSTLIPSITLCKFDTPGERRFARLLEAKLENDYLCWYNVPIGPSRLHPDTGFYQRFIEAGDPPNEK